MFEIFGVKNAGYVATPNFKSNFTIHNFAVKKTVTLRIRNPDSRKKDRIYNFDLESDVDNMFECIRIGFKNRFLKALSIVAFQVMSF